MKTKYYLQSVWDPDHGEAVPMLCYIPMNTPIMLVRVDNRLRLRKLGTSNRVRVALPRSPEQTTLL